MNVFGWLSGSSSSEAEALPVQHREGGAETVVEAAVAAAGVLEVEVQMLEVCCWRTLHRGEGREILGARAAETRAGAPAVEAILGLALAWIPGTIPGHGLKPVFVSPRAAGGTGGGRRSTGGLSPRFWAVWFPRRCGRRLARVDRPASIR